MAFSLAALGVNLDRLYHGQPVVAGGTIYTAVGTAGSGKRTQISSVLVCNPSTSDLKVRLGLVPQGSTADGTHYLLGDVLIPARTTLPFALAITMRAADVLEAQSESLPAPTGLVGTGSTTGGTLTAATYYYRVTGTNANGETVTSNEVSVLTSGSTSSVVLTWNRSLGVTGYKVYRATTSGSNLLIATIGSGSTVTYTDTAVGSPSGAFPTTGTAAGCIFTVSGAELPA